MIKTLRLFTSKKGYGGNIYELMVDEALKSQFSHEIVQKSARFRGLLRLLEVPLIFLNFYRFSQRTDAFLVRTFQTALFNYRHKGLTIIYHVDASYSPPLAYAFQKLVEWIFFFRAQKSEPIVVIAKYWKDFLESRGYTNVHLIYCAYDIDAYSVTADEIALFRQKYGLENKKLVYIGNPQKKKGADICCEVLKNSGYTLVATGEADLQLPALQLKLSFKEYLCLLATSEVVLTMSRFKEGWNRVAHEAMLLGTPVIGSGLGGMAEVLTGGHQMICQEPKQLPELIEKARQNRSFYAECGRKYAEQFPIDRFNRQWCDLVRKLNQA